ncbi:MAG: 2-isopropylmalate synthase [Bacillota bacterium]|nr:2-isopropylmalate synthase [Bacillota bacterium]
MRKISFFDTTLRDGEQTPGVNLNLREKVEIARELALMGVDTIEAGFPASSQGSFNAVLEVAKEIKGVQVAGLCRAVAGDVQRAWEALRYADAPRIHIVIATSERHMLYKLRMSEEEVTEAAIKAIKTAKSYCSSVQFSAEDASRSDPAFLCRILYKAVAAGATVVNIPDTVGYATPAEYAALIAYVREHVDNIDKARIAAHCHNDLGMATANTLAAVSAGAEQVEVTINGIGERAGNAALEEVAMALNTRADFYDCEHNINTTHINRVCRLVSKYSGLEIAAGKAIIGDNAFRHQSGIHQHGVLTDRETYQIMTPESIGRYSGEQFVLGKLSGWHAFGDKLAELGFHLPENEIKSLFERFKLLADRKKEVTAKDIIAIVEGKMGDVKPVVELENYQILSANNVNSTATVCLDRGGERLQMAAIAGGPIDAAYKAITEMLGLELSLESYAIKAVTEGADALGEVTVRVKYNGSVYLGKGVATDVIKSSMLAYINAVNRIYADMIIKE